jgi:hypothetical protein
VASALAWAGSPPGPGGQCRLAPPGCVHVNAECASARARCAPTHSGGYAGRAGAGPAPCRPSRSCRGRSAGTPQAHEGARPRPGPAAGPARRRPTPSPPPGPIPPSPPSPPPPAALPPSPAVPRPHGPPATPHRQPEPDRSRPAAAAGRGGRLQRRLRGCGPCGPGRGGGPGLGSPEAKGTGPGPQEPGGGGGGGGSEHQRSRLRSARVRQAEHGIGPGISLRPLDSEGDRQGIRPHVLIALPAAPSRIRVAAGTMVVVAVCGQSWGVSKRHPTVAPEVVIRACGPTSRTRAGSVSPAGSPPDKSRARPSPASPAMPAGGSASLMRAARAAAAAA